MGKAKTSGKKEESRKEDSGKILVSIYPDEIELVTTTLKEDYSKELIGETLNSRDIRLFFGLKPTHRKGIKTELRSKIAELTIEEQKDLLSKLKNE